MLIKHSPLQELLVHSGEENLQSSIVIHVHGIQRPAEPSGDPSRQEGGGQTSLSVMRQDCKSGRTDRDHTGGSEKGGQPLLPPLIEQIGRSVSGAFKDFTPKRGRTNREEAGEDIVGGRMMPKNLVPSTGSRGGT